jgi:hypothetical protein
MVSFRRAAAIMVLLAILAAFSVFYQYLRVSGRIKPRGLPGATNCVTVGYDFTTCDPRPPKNHKPISN